MPRWFEKQMRKAYFDKDTSQIKMLNQCWFFYLRKTNI
ncbi:cortex morphogenetic protein CmpA [Peribacillus sp. SCS-155]